MDNFEAVKAATSLEDYAADHLERMGNKYICPCGSGKGKNRTPAFSLYKDNGELKWKCQSCQRGGDIFDLAAYVEGIDENNKMAQLEAVASWANIPIDTEPTPKATAAKPTPKPKRPAPDYTANRQREAEYIKACAARIFDYPEAVQYLTDRGFTESEIKEFGIGYDPSHPQGWKDSAGAWHNGGRIVIPWQYAPWYHIDRALDDNADDRKYTKPASETVGRQPFYNPDALNAEAFFIVEGLLDALAVEACGYEAVALAGTGNAETFQHIADEAEGAAIVLTDSDKAGDDARARIISGLKERGAFVIESRINAFRDSDETKPIKDASEWLEYDRDALKSFLTAEHNKALIQHRENEEQAYIEALTRLRVKDPLDVATSLFMGEYYEEPTPTGIKSLDQVLGGGLKSGLYALGAVSSLGKTSLALQVADTVARQGRSVLFCTIEQSAGELVSKSLARLVFTLSGGSTQISAAAVMGGAASFDPMTQQALTEACEVYGRQISPSLKILEGIEQPRIEDVRRTAEYIATHEGRPPCVFIDYLQLMKPPNDRYTDKQGTDFNMMALRHLARDLKTPVFVISSLNRSSYSEGVQMDSWKESGSVEYSADCLIGLQPQGITEAIEKAGDKTAKREAAKYHRDHKGGAVRECEIVILKNRSGATPKEPIPLTFRTIPSLFEEPEEKPKSSYIRL